MFNDKRRFTSLVFHYLQIGFASAAVNVEFRLEEGLVVVVDDVDSLAVVVAVVRVPTSISRFLLSPSHIGESFQHDFNTFKIGDLIVFRNRLDILSIF